MPKRIDAKLKERCVRQVLDHLPEYPSLMSAVEAVARREGVGKESVRRWVRQAQVDRGERQGATSEELVEIRELKAKVRRLEEDNEILRRASIFSAALRLLRRQLSDAVFTALRTDQRTTSTTTAQARAA